MGNYFLGVTRMTASDESQFVSDQLMRKPGDRILSDDWNILVQAIDHLCTTKVNRNQADTLIGPLTIEDALQVSSNVGIGTDKPIAKLEVKGTTNDDQAAGLNIIDSEAKSILYVRNDGNVGIGTDSPGAKLDVNGGIKSPALQSIYVQANQWETSTTDSNWQVVISYEFTPITSIHATVIVNGHGMTEKIDQPLDCAIFNNDQIFADRGDGYGYGMGISHVSFWLPLQAIAKFYLEANQNYKIELKIRSRSGGKVRFNGATMLILLTGT